ncbi:MAG: methylated-DNA--[protein]-cysteine S-methyltransferase [Patescibacteria group bacterium]
MNNFYQRVYELVANVPSGHVVTYGQIAASLSSPRAARMVGTALRSLPEGSHVPWHRVIGSKGRISIQNMDHPAEEQANLLMAEGVVVRREQDAFCVDLARYLWRLPSPGDQN